MSKNSDFKESVSSEKFATKEELTKELNKCKSVQDQEEEYRRIQSGEEKRNLCEGDATFSPDPNKMQSVSSNDTSLLFSPPPSYFNTTNCTPSLDSIPISSLKSEKGETATNSQPSGRSYHNILLKNLQFETRRQLGLHLDLERANVANWKSVACEIGFTNLEIQNYDMDRNKTQRMLNETEVIFPTVTIGNLCEILEKLDRRDVITEMEEYFVREANGPRRVFPRSIAGSGSFQPSAGPASFSTHPASGHPSFTSSPPPFSTTSVTPLRQVSMETASLRSQVLQDDSISTTGNSVATDITRLTEKDSYSSLPAQPTPLTPEPTSLPLEPRSLPPEYNPVPPQLFDAFVLHDVADKNFILNEFLPKVEGEANIKLFIPGRDSPPGGHCFDSQLQIMMNNCPKLVVIQSDEFLRSPLSRWSLNIALSLDPAARNRKIIPVIYKRVTEPSILAGISACDRTRVLEDSWFWNGIIRSLKQTH